ncbi:MULTISPECIES: putative holin-like toxin [Lactobacillaceae]|uniref:putative holin-like toxin n=1 Tax=Lactobacillaceae TaxID=33958 RepID=UPI00349F5670
MTLVNGGTFIVALIALIVELIKSQQENYSAINDRVVLIVLGQYLIHLYNRLSKKF